MGILCSKAHPEEYAEEPKDSPNTNDTEHSSQPSHSATMTRLKDLAQNSGADKKTAGSLIDAHDAAISSLQLDSLPNKLRSVGAGLDAGFRSEQDYEKFREQLIDRERALGFDYRCHRNATPLESRVDTILKTLRKRDDRKVYDAADPRRGHGGQTHKRFAGDHFLSNVDLIEQTALFDIAGHMPKGAHLHIHFNACLKPSALLDIAKTMGRMFITSTEALVPDNGHISYNKCQIQFSLLCPEKENPGNIFHPSYKKGNTMKFSDFRASFPGGEAAADQWLMSKLVFHDDEAHNLLQTAAGAWEKFNGRTRMMKGLFNYEKAFREYTKLCLEDFMRDNIQYAEIRPNFMRSNQLYHDDGKGTIGNEGIMGIIIDEVEKFRTQVASKGKFFGGLKVIYCTPRSFKKNDVEDALDECIEFKKKWPEWIAGFDIVGEEAAGHPLKTFVPEFLRFKKKCAAAKLDIPFLFHCGETLEMGGDTDGNLFDALMLGSKRIGHGFALPRHPYVMQHMRERGVCLELCPISNEVLGLTTRVSGHAMYDLLANNVHCTVSSDNGTLFRSSLSHDFYQVMIGKADMGLAGWKQLVLWSIEHACMDDKEREKVLNEWNKLWQEFLEWVVNKYGDVRE